MSGQLGVMSAGVPLGGLLGASWGPLGGLAGPRAAPEPQKGQVGPLEPPPGTPKKAWVFEARGLFLLTGVVENSHSVSWRAGRKAENFFGEWSLRFLHV